MSNPVKLFIVEGEDRDYRLAKEMTQCFFFHGKYEAKVINLPAKQNIYMLYQILKKDDFDSDIVEILRDTVDNAQRILTGVSRQDIDEIYMFFDYDIHQDNLSQSSNNATPESVIRTLLTVFNNETENGKLYISYPMVEAIYDCREFMCQAYSSCYVSTDQVHNYKCISGKDNPFASSHMDIVSWKKVLNAFALRISCLYEKPSISFSDYRNEVKATPYKYHFSCEEAPANETGSHQ